MSLIGKDIIEEMVKKFKIIHPFNPSLLDGDSYILTVDEDVELKYLEHKNVLSHEIVFVPPDFVCHMTAKSKFGRMGLSFLNAAKAHSGWVGRIVLEIVNLNNDRKPVVIRKGEPFMHIEFIRREGEPWPYQGEYMFQHMSEEEIDMYMKIMKENWPNVFDEDYLKKAKEKALSRV
jgi:dCTP deaminase